MALNLLTNSFKQPLIQRSLIRAPIRQYTVQPSFLSNTPYTRVTSLPSGIRVATADGTGDIATVGVWLGIGSANETDAFSGVNNFLHKIILSGGSRSSLNSDIESLGATLTGHADRESTAFVGQTHKNDIPKFVEILGDLVSKQQFNQEVVQSIREKILNIHRANRNKFDLATLTDHVHAAAFQGSSHANTPIGEPDVIKNIPIDKIIEYQKQFYTTKDLVLVGTGAVQHDQLVKLAQHFTQLPATAHSPFGRVDFVGSEIRIRDDTAHKVKAAYAWEVVGRSHPHYWTCLLLQTFVGNWDQNSILGSFPSCRWAEAVTQYKLAYQYTSRYIPYSNTGLFQIYTETTMENQEDALYAHFNEFQKLAAYITEEEMRRAKNQLKVSLLAKLEDQMCYAKSIGETVLVNHRAVSIAEYFQRIDEIQIQDVQKLLTTFFEDIDPVLVAHGPIEEFPDYNLVRGWTYWNRW